MDASNHVCEVVHAQIETTGLSEQAVVKHLLVGFRIVWGFPEGCAVLFLSVTAPHAIDRFLASEEVVATLSKHLGMADFHSNLIKLALSVLIAKHSYLFCTGNDSFQIDTELMLAILLLFVMQ